MSEVEKDSNLVVGKVVIAAVVIFIGYQVTFGASERREKTALKKAANDALYGLTAKQEIDVCKIAIGKINGRAPSTMSAEVKEGYLTTVSYSRPSDGKRFHYECTEFNNGRFYYRTHYDGSWGKELGGTNGAVKVNYKLVNNKPQVAISDNY